MLKWILIIMMIPLVEAYSLSTSEYTDYFILSSGGDNLMQDSINDTSALSQNVIGELNNTYETYIGLYYLYNTSIPTIVTEIIEGIVGGGAVSGAGIDLESLKQNCVNQSMDYEVVNNTVYCILKEIKMETQKSKPIWLPLLLILIYLGYLHFRTKRELKKTKQKQEAIKNEQ